VRGLNKKHLRANPVFDVIFELCTNTPFNDFKSPDKALNYMQEVFNLLGITIKPPICK
jgi:hypothetical protein